MVANSVVNLKRLIISPLACSVLAMRAIWLRLPPILASCRSSSGSAVLIGFFFGVLVSKQVFLIQVASSAPIFFVQ